MYPPSLLNSDRVGGFCIIEDKQATIAQIEEIRQELHTIIDTKIDTFIKQYITGDDPAVTLESSTTKQGLLRSVSAIFKGTKPVSVMLPSGATVYTKTWKKVVTAILVDCNSDKDIHNSLLEMRGKIFGNFRTILSDGTSKLTAPIKIDEDLYFETKYDTETLLHVLKERVLDVVGYDYSTILIQYKEK